MASTKRIIIGSEIDDSKHLELMQNGSQITLPVSVYSANGTLISPALNAFGVGAFDEVNLTYSGSNVTIAVYKLSNVTIATLTLTYSGGNVIRVVKT